MRIGVVCEGVTDFIAIREFTGAALRARGLEVEFVGLQPIPDRTRAEAGWGNLLNWLRRNNPEARVREYFSGGLFANSLSEKQCDAIILQMDADILGEQSFIQNVVDWFNYAPAAPDDPFERGQEIERVLKIAAGLNTLCEEDRNRQ